MGEIMAKIEYYWHIHHDELIEPTVDIKERENYIMAYKPENEIPLRLELMTKMEHPRKLPKEWKDTYKELYKLNKEWDKLYVIWNYSLVGESKSMDIVDKKINIIEKKIEKDIKKIIALNKKYKSQFEALHKEEHPDCPWNGKTIFIGDNFE